MRLIAFAYFVHFLRHGMVSPLVPLFAGSMGCSGAMIGAAVSAFSLLSLLAALPTGRLSDRLGARTLLLLSAGFNLLYSLLLVATTSIWLLIPAQMIGGLGFLLLIVSSQTWVSAHTDKGVRERGFGLLSLAAALGQTMGPFLGGLVLSGTSFAGVFSLAACFSLLGFSIAGLDKQWQDKPLERKKSSGGAIKETLAWLASDRKMVAALIFTFTAVFAANLRSSFLPVLLQARGLSGSTIGLLLSAFALSMTLVRLVIGRIMGRFSRESLLILALALLFAGAAALPTTSSAGLTAGIIFLFGMGFGISQPLSMVMISDRAGTASGQAMGIRFFVITLATLLSPIQAGLVVDAFGLAAAFFCVGAVILAAGLLIRIVGYRRR